MTPPHDPARPPLQSPPPQHRGCQSRSPHPVAPSSGKPQFLSGYKQNPKQDLFSLSATSGLSKCVEKMVNVLKGVLIECDPAMKQFLLYLDESNALGKKFIIQDLDETHVFVLAELVNFLQERVGELMDQNSFPITQK
ncbi:unnamed protein product [Caretta caretta]